MSYDAVLADRLRATLGRRRGLTEKPMFGGLAFLLHGNLLCGILRDELVLRLGSDQAAAALLQPHVRPFDFTGRPMKGWVMVGPAGLHDLPTLAAWLGRAIDFVAQLPPK